jgi:hypothetical protein
MWQLEAESDYKKALKRLVKKHRREVQAAHDNLDTFFRAISAGAAPRQVKMGCIHPEPSGVLAFDQKGGGAGLKEIRLYTYPDEDTEALYLITIGDKNSQGRDVLNCREWVTDLRKKKAEEKQRPPMQ